MKNVSWYFRWCSQKIMVPAINIRWNSNFYSQFGISFLFRAFEFGRFKIETVCVCVCVCVALSYQVHLSLSFRIRKFSFAFQRLSCHKIRRSIRCAHHCGSTLEFEYMTPNYILAACLNSYSFCSLLSLSWWLDCRQNYRYHFHVERKQTVKCYRIPMKVNDKNIRNYYFSQCDTANADIALAHKMGQNMARRSQIRPMCARYEFSKQTEQQILCFEKQRTSEMSVRHHCVSNAKTS